MQVRATNRLRTHTSITEAALALFVERGYEGTTVEQIASAAGVSSATFFRYFPSKEDVLFATEGDAADSLVSCVRDRTDRRQDLSALEQPVVAYAGLLTDGSVPVLTRLVMTTPALESRSLRMRLRWERELAAHLATERGEPGPRLEQTLVAAVAVSCLTSSLRHWDVEGAPLPALVGHAFDAVLGQGDGRAR